MAEITADMVKMLREATGAGVLDSKKALTEYDGDFEKASEALRERGLAKAAKKSEREANEGIIGVYVHSNQKMAAIVRLNCETDFVARNEAFQQLAKELAMHVVASRPTYVSREEIPAADLEAKKALFAEEIAASGKPANIVDKIAEGKLEKWYQDSCLLEQGFVRNPDITVQSLLTDAIAKLGENIKIGGFERLEIGA
jgi:elongation factor Ts